ncbi:hypothetical protein NGC65_00770 [Staphylococcus xylosus]|uniref:hypothetical protein n=1 Tax=Staphylococcus xylosus TaxID=1288 RepID=UPI002DBAE404|nr:hypothetical protein [Staphylococcus xylosus]MEB6291622.1 hypothetical protein [Staphylococcus xylosus]MEB7719776.1 hypothetical protein [Staphylococcus xylosus]MEB7812936.1 hypothetical protein [Staphylococcus xylosus]MEB7820954.1 hypothetical protein [Staphylococcus xylosus]MEB7836722.1 hypothetical protein [Staphylococcus xylosus]
MIPTPFAASLKILLNLSGCIVLDELNKHFSETKLLLKQGYRDDIVREKMNDKVFGMQLKFKELGQKMIDEHETKLQKLEQDNKVVTFDDPQAELLKRQDLEAKVSLIDNNELVHLIQNIDSNDVGVYEISVYAKAIEKRLTDDQQKRVRDFHAVKEKILYPFRNNDEYQQLEQDLAVLYQYGMQIKGEPVDRDSEGNIRIMNIADEYNNIFK